MKIAPTAIYSQTNKIRNNHVAPNTALPAGNANVKNNVSFGSNPHTHSRMQSGWNHLKKKWPHIVIGSGATAIACFAFPPATPVLVGMPFALSALFFAGGALRNKD